MSHSKSDKRVLKNCIELNEEELNNYHSYKLIVKPKKRVKLRSWEGEYQNIYSRNLDDWKDADGREE